MAKGNRTVQVRVDDATREAWQDAADLAGVKLPAYIRDTVNASLGTPVVALAADITQPASKPSQRTTDEATKKLGLCVHRVPLDSYCKTCG